VFAILCLRSLYFLLAEVIDKFHYLKAGLSIVLVFIGAKMLATIVGLHIDTAVSLGVVALVLIGSVVLSLLRPKPAEDATDASDPGDAESDAAPAGTEETGR